MNQMDHQQKENLIEVNHLSVTFHNGKNVNNAVQDVTFRIKEGEVLGVVGESGSGKSVSAMSIMRLTPGEISGGEILFEGEDLLKKSEEEMMKIRGNKISVIFQEPMTSLIRCTLLLRRLLRLLSCIKRRASRKQNIWL